MRSEVVRPAKLPSGRGLMLQSGQMDRYGLPGTSGSSGPGGLSGLALTVGLNSAETCVYCFPQTYSNSTKSPLASVPVKRSSMIPPRRTRKNHLNFCRPLSGIRLVIGYAATTCQSATDIDTSSWALEVITSPLEMVGDTTTDTLFLWVKDIDFRSDRPRSE